MKTELFYLASASALTASMWMPYVLNRLFVRGLGPTLGYPENAKAQSGWAQRLMAAHSNAVENLVVFAALLLTANAVGISNPIIAVASMVYFWSRLAHAISYTFGKRSMNPILARMIC
jgi:MAPEG family